MQQDFAKRRGGKSKTRTHARSQARNQGRNKRSTGSPRASGGRAVAPNRYFHGPSFSGGIVLGAIVVIGTAYLPEFLPSLLQRSANLTERASAAIEARAASETAGQGAAEQIANTAPPASSTLRFDFEEMLTKNTVKAEPEKYYDPEQQRDAPTTKEILLQAASFRTEQEANALRAELLLMDLPVATASVELASGRWIRVTVGPFASAVQANRAVTALREQAISPIWIERKAT